MKELLGLTPEDAALLLRLVERGPSRSAEDALGWAVLGPKIADHARWVVPPMGDEKVWSGMTSWPRRIIDDGSTHNQLYTIVRASSRAEAVRLLNDAGLNENAGHMKNYWSETGNREALVTATEKGVWAYGKYGWVKL